MNENKLAATIIKDFPYFSPMENETAIQEQSTSIKKESYQSYRWIENGHILLWLIKDTCWAMEYRPGAMFMIAPTISVAFYILWRSRRSRVDIFHNVAVGLWISANSIWMTGEFYKIELRPYAAVLFLTGLTTLLVYYLFYFKKDRKAELAE